MRPIDADALMDVLVAVMDDYRANGEILKAKATVCAIKLLEKETISPTLDLAPKWISVKDRLPEEEKEVLCYLGNALGKGIVVAFRRHGDWYFDGWKCPTVTHWMPLPEPPKEG
jgi:hypothetical protein